VEENPEDRQKQMPENEVRSFVNTGIRSALIMPF
jgi:hypothetical protein